MSWDLPPAPMGAPHGPHTHLRTRLVAGWAPAPPAAPADTWMNNAWGGGGPNIRGLGPPQEKEIWKAGVGGVETVPGLRSCGKALWGVEGHRLSECLGPQPQEVGGLQGGDFLDTRVPPL